MSRRVKPCGTTAAYFRHIRNGETTCQPCRDAMTAQRQRYARTPRERAWNLTDEVSDWLHLDGGWLTAEGLAMELDRNTKSVERTLRQLRADGVVESRVMELAGMAARDRRMEWRIA